MNCENISKSLMTVFPLSPLLRGVRGRRKAKRHLLSFKPWSLFTGSVIIISCQTIPVKPSEQLFNMFGSGVGGAAECALRGEQSANEHILIII